jgi:uncharacterized protein (TIGR00290 family)
MELERIVMSWSGGKDSCMALHELRASAEYEVAMLLTTITRDQDRISMHGVRRTLLQAQAEALGLPLREVSIPATCSNADYERLMGKALGALRGEGFSTIAFGDLYLADIRAYRDRLVEANGMRALYPVWGRDTADFAQAVIALGYRAVTTTVDPAVLDQSYAGRLLGQSFLADLPEGVDPCGENGEFHSFVFDGPLFARPIPFRVAERETRNSLCFCDLEPSSLCDATFPAQDMERQAC